MTDEQRRWPAVTEQELLCRLVEDISFLKHQNNLLFRALQQVGVLSAVWDEETGDAIGLNCAVQAPTITSGVSQT